MSNLIIDSAFDDFVHQVKRGMEGKNTLIPTGFPKLNNHIGLGKGVYILVGGESGTGKCLCKGTKITMHDGTLKEVEKIQPGDLVMGMDSTARKVTSITKGKEQMYWIRQKNGLDYRVNASHLVALRYNRPGVRQGEINTYTAEDIYNEERTTFLNYNKGFKVSIEFKERELPIDPYLLGLWLGDGGEHKLQITTPDKEIIEYLHNRSDYELTEYPNKNKSVNVSITSRGREVRNIETGEEFSTVKEAANNVDRAVTNIVYACKNKATSAGYHWEYVHEEELSYIFNSLNLFGNKHIPQIFISNSRKNRLQLLAGLVDSDGTKDSRNNCYSISTIRKELAKQITFLCRSLGFYTSLKPRISDVVLPNGKKIKNYKSYRVLFTSTEELPCKIERKKPGKSHKKETLSTGIKVEKDTVDDYYGFTLEGKDKYFLLEDCTVTHNTALNDEMFVLNPYQWYIDHYDETDKKLRIIYRSMERSQTHKIAKWVCRRLWLKHNILVDVKTILGWNTGKKFIPRDIFDQVVDTRDYFEEMFDVVQIIDGAINPTGMYKQCRNISWNEGFLIKSDAENIRYYNYKYPKGKVVKTFSKEKYKITKGGTKLYYEEMKLKDKAKFIPQYHVEYFPNYENIVNVIIGDHNGKWRNEQGFDDKMTLDKASEYYGEIRDIYKWSPIAINQFNRNISDTTRRIKTDLSPEKQDFKGSGNMYEDADFVCAIFNPSESGLLEFKKYQIKGFTASSGFNRFRSFHILKNSFGIDNITTGLNFIGECGHFQEIQEKPNEMLQHHYKKYNSPEINPPNFNEQVKVLA